MNTVKPSYADYTEWVITWLCNHGYSAPLANQIVTQSPVLRSSFEAELPFYMLAEKLAERHPMNTIHLCGNCGQDKPAGSLYDLCETCAQKEGWSTHTERTFTCPFCEAVATESAAIEAGWVPSFWNSIHEFEEFTPVCLQCSKSVLSYSNHHGDFYLPQPIIASAWRC